MVGKVVSVLFVGFVCISMVVAFTPSIMNISTGSLDGMTKVAVDLGMWLIPLGATFLVVMGAVRLLQPREERYTNQTFSGGSRLWRRWVVNRRLADPGERRYRAARRAARGRGMAGINEYSREDSAWF